MKGTLVCAFSGGLDTSIICMYIVIVAMESSMRSIANNCCLISEMAH